MLDRSAVPSNRLWGLATSAVRLELGLEVELGEQLLGARDRLPTRLRCPRERHPAAGGVGLCHEAPRERDGIVLRNCPPYIREWITREQEP